MINESNYHSNKITKPFTFLSFFLIIKDCKKKIKFNFTFIIAVAVVTLGIL